MSEISELYLQYPKSLLALGALADKSTHQLTNGHGWRPNDSFEQKIFKLFHYWVIRDIDLRTVLQGYDDGITKPRQILNHLELREQIYRKIIGEEPLECKHGIAKRFTGKRYILSKPCKHCNSDLVREAKAKITQSEKDLIHKKRNQTMLDRYGVTNAMHLDELKQKVFQSPAHTKGTLENQQKKARVKQTNLERYGVENPFANEQIKDKIKQTNLERYGVENPMYLDELKQRQHNTLIERYGVLDVWELGRKAGYEKYNGKNPFSSKEVKEKIKQTNLDRYGVEHISQTKENRQAFGERMTQPDIVEKRNKVNLEKFGHISPLANKDVRERGYNTLEQRFGARRASHIKIPKETLELMYDKEKFMRTFPEKYNDAKYISEALDIHYTTVFGIFARFGIEVPLYYNKGEQEICDWLETHNIHYERRNTSIIKPYEIDILLPEYKIAIEFNSDYWHSELKKELSYHYKKHKLITNAGFKYFMIHEHEWMTRKIAVQKLLLNKMGKSPKGIAARKLLIRKLNLIEMHQFLEKYHIQGSIQGTDNIGAFDKDKLVAVMGFRRNNKLNCMELARYATDEETHSGVFSRLLTYYIRNNNVEEMITYADKRFSSGDVYLKNGFTFDKEIDPEYSYLIENQLWHSDSLRRNVVEQIFDIKLGKQSVKDYLSSINILRIGDCGKLRFRLKL